MRFLKLTIENYKSFQFATEIPFPVNTDGQSIFLIGGMNGAGKTSIMEAINFCLYGAKADEIYRNINRREKATGNPNVAFELVIEMDDESELIVKRSWTAGVVADPKPRDLIERLVVVRDGKRVSARNQEIWQDFIRAAIPPGITQFFFFDGEKIQEIAADDHFEVRLKSSLEVALGIQYINRLASDIAHLKQEERKGFVEISDEDLEFKQSEFKKEKSKLSRKQHIREGLQTELDCLKEQLNEAKDRFGVAFHAEPESREAMREQERKRIQTANRLTQVESEIRGLCEKALPFSLTGGLFDGIRKQIEAERESASAVAIKRHAAELAKRLVRVVVEPEPIFPEKLPEEKMQELERRIFQLLRKGHFAADVVKLLDLSGRDAAHVLSRMEMLEGGDVFLIQPLLEEKHELETQSRMLEEWCEMGGMADSERDLFDQLQSEMENCSTQIGRNSEQLRLLDDEILTLEKCINDIALDIEKLFEKHNVSKEKADFI
jgi:DNA sulfur modification protein DndD